jgi:hypothetical protein
VVDCGEPGGEHDAERGPCLGVDISTDDDRDCRTDEGQPGDEERLTQAPRLVTQLVNSWAATWEIAERDPE